MFNPRPPMLRRLPLLLALVLAGCTTLQPNAPATPSEPSAEIAAGPMLGYATHREATVWVQTTTSADISISYVPKDHTDGFDLLMDSTPTIRTSAESDHIARFTITDLEPGTRYEYDVLIDGVAAPEPVPLVFETQALWQHRTDPPDFTVAVGSCAYVNEPAYDRPGDPYGGDYRIFESIRALDPDLMLWTGDNTYLREVDWWSEAGIRHRYAHTRALPELQGLLANQPNYATWDDHDYGPNDSDRSYVLKGAALDVFTDYWANPSYGLPGVPGVFGQFQWNDVEFFLLDDRYHRTPNRTPATERRAMLGEAQLTWLLDALTASRAPFKMVVLGGQVLNPTAIYETYANVAPEERERLIAGIVARRIEGVVFLSGDRHHTEVIRLQPDGFYPLYDFTSSPLTAGAATPSREMDNPARVPNTLVFGKRNFGTLTFSGPRTDRTLTMRTYDADGRLLWTYAVRADDLRLPRD